MRIVLITAFLLLLDCVLVGQEPCQTTPAQPKVTVIKVPPEQIQRARDLAEMANLSYEQWLGMAVQDCTKDPRMCKVDVGKWKQLKKIMDRLRREP